MDLLFVFAEWHGFVKLRLHTDHTIEILDRATTQLGDHLRQFVDTTCKEIPTKELRREYEARKRRDAKAAKKKGKVASSTHATGNTGPGLQNPASKPPASSKDMDSGLPAQTEPESASP
jgi:hypothetical protein